MPIAALRDGGRLIEYYQLSPGDEWDNRARSYKLVPLPENIPAKNCGFWFATTVPRQEAGIAHLRANGFRPVRYASNPNTRNLVTFWWRAGNGRFSPCAKPMDDTCCGMRSYNPDAFELPKRIYGLKFVAETSRKWDGERRMTYLGEFEGHHYYIGGGRPCRVE